MKKTNDRSDFALINSEGISYPAEAGVISAVLQDPEKFLCLQGMLDSSDFKWQAYGWVWGAFQDLHDEGLRIDSIMVGDHLMRKNQIDDFVLADDQTFSGRAALSHLRDLGDPRAAESYAKTVKDYAAKRKQLELFTKGAYLAANGQSADYVKNYIAGELESIETWNGQLAKHTVTIADAAQDAYNRTDSAAAGKIACVPTGFMDLDKLLGGGLYAPGFYLVAGRPGQGKSAFLTSVAYNAAKQEKHIVHFGLEMANFETAQRLIAMVSGVTTDRQRDGKLNGDQWQEYIQGVEEVASLPITLNDLPAITPSQVRQVLRRVGKVDLVILDYIQLASVDSKRRNRYEEVDAISQGFKTIAKEFDVPFFAAAQMSRAVEQRSNKRPILSDLRESGGLEQDSDVVMFIYRSDQYEKDTAKQNVTEIVLAKHRNGPVGSVELIYRPSITRFENAVTRKVTFNDDIDYSDDFTNK